MEEWSRFASLSGRNRKGRTDQRNIQYRISEQSCSCCEVTQVYSVPMLEEDSFANFQKRVWTFHTCIMPDSGLTFAERWMRLFLQLDSFPCGFVVSVATGPLGRCPLALLLVLAVAAIDISNKILAKRSRGCLKLSRATEEEREFKFLALQVPTQLPLP